jgi:hypothetical protein
VQYSLAWVQVESWVQEQAVVVGFQGVAWVPGVQAETEWELVQGVA